MTPTAPLPCWSRLFLAGWLLTLLFACNRPRTQSAEVQPSNNDTSALMHQFLAGLWSVDSENALSNEGFYIQPDGQLSLVASEVRGQWKLLGRDTLRLLVDNWSPKPQTYDFIIDSLDPQLMILRDSAGQRLYRKVPYGTNAEGTVLNGFMGTLDRQLSAKEYRFDLPSAKRIRVELNTAATRVSFRLFSGEHELTAAAVKRWEGILVRSGQYRAVVALDPPELQTEEPVEFDLKVYGY